ncbi:MAG: replication initiation factor domain-containing protein [Geobacter sp.]|nr:MAG: replication initiation factor domain-containing protein [Geobacter sp.]
MDRSVKVDYLNFTTRRSLPDVISLFSYLANPLQPDEKGLYGYSFRMSSPDGVMVLYSAGRDDIHVQLSGRACDRDLFSLIELVGPSDFVTRCDIAIDCIGSGFTCAEIWRLLRGGSFSSVSSTIRQVEGLLSRPGQSEGTVERLAQRVRKTRINSGHTIYIGASTSDRMVRIYDKGAESETGADWLRFEIQLRRASANQFFLEGVKHEDFSDKALSLLNRQLTLYTEGQEAKIENRHHDRCEVHSFWSLLTSKMEKLILQIPKPIKSVRNALRYVKNCGSTIKMLKQVMPDFNEFFESVVDDAQLKPHHKQIQDDYAEVGHSRSDEYELYLMGCTV